VSFPEPRQWNGDDMEPMPSVEDERHPCEQCGEPCTESELVWRLVCRQTMSSPAEHEPIGCAHCLGGEDYDEAYERAAAKYDGEGKDWR
jgi:hypothetical protein